MPVSNGAKQSSEFCRCLSTRTPLQVISKNFHSVTSEKGALKNVKPVHYIVQCQRLQSGCTPKLLDDMAIPFVPISILAHIVLSLMLLPAIGLYVTGMILRIYQDIRHPEFEDDDVGLAVRWDVKWGFTWLGPWIIIILWWCLRLVLPQCVPETVLTPHRDYLIFRRRIPPKIDYWQEAFIMSGFFVTNSSEKHLFTGTDRSLAHFFRSILVGIWCLGQFSPAARDQLVRTVLDYDNPAIGIHGRSARRCLSRAEDSGRGTSLHPQADTRFPPPKHGFPETPVRFTLNVFNDQYPHQIGTERFEPTFWALARGAAAIYCGVGLFLYVYFVWGTLPSRESISIQETVQPSTQISLSELQKIALISVNTNFSLNVGFTYPRLFDRIAM